MTERYLSELFSDEVRCAQAARSGRALPNPGVTDADLLGPDEAEFIAARDSFYLATVSAAGWPYVQHRGGPTGFLRVLDPRTLAFADFKGNRQLISAGHASVRDKVSLFLIDYPQRLRLKILGYVRVRDARADPDPRVVDVLSPALSARVERIFEIRVLAFDWNCPSYITPRYTAAEVEAVVAPLRARIAELEAAQRRG